MAPKTQVNSATGIMGVTGCVSGDTVLRLNRAKNGQARTIASEVYNRHRQMGRVRQPGLITYTRALREDRIGLHATQDIVHSGVKRTYRLVTVDGPTLRATADHGIHTPDGYVPLGDLRYGMEVTGEDLQRRIPPPETKKPEAYYPRVTGLRFHPFAGRFRVSQRGGPIFGVDVHRAVVEAHLNGLRYEDFIEICRNDARIAAQLLFLDPEVFAIHHRDRDPKNPALDNLRLMSHQAHGRLHGDASHFGEGFTRTWKVQQVDENGDEDTFDVICEEPYRNFLANGLVVHNSGKSSLLATLAKYVWRHWHMVSILYSSDGGGFPAELQACIAAGIVRVFRMYTRDPGDLGLSFETCQRACQGWLPRKINPATGEVEPGVEMVPPVALRFEMRCADGHLVKTVPSESLLLATICPTCRKPVTRADMRVQKTLTRNRGFENVGAVMYDGLSSMLAWELREMGHRAGRLELKGEEGSIGGKVISGDLKFGGSTRSHVGFVQARGEELVHLTLGIPNLVVPPIFTMLTHEDVDERSLSIIGPKISGRAKTDEAPQWFGNMLETAKIPALQGAGEQRILYLNEFTDPRGVRHLCKHRGSPGTMPAYLIDPPEDQAHPELAFTQFNLGLFFEMLDAALDKRIDEVKTEFPDAPGLPEGVVEVGDMSIVAGPTGPAVPTVQPVQPVQVVNVPLTVSGQAVATVAAPASPAVQNAPPTAPAAPRARARRASSPQPPASAPLPGAATLAATQPVERPVVEAQAALPVNPTLAEIQFALPLAEPSAVQVPTPATRPAPVPSPATASVAPPAGSSGPVARPVGVAPPPGRRPSVPAPLNGGAVTAATATGSAGPTPSTTGTPAGVQVTGPAAPRPVAAVPRPPAAAPRPPAARPVATPRPQSTTIA